MRFFILRCHCSQVRGSLDLLFPCPASYVHQSIFANNRKKVRRPTNILCDQIFTLQNCHVALLSIFLHLLNFLFYQDSAYFGNVTFICLFEVIALHMTFLVKVPASINQVKSLKQGFLNYGFLHF